LRSDKSQRGRFELGTSGTTGRCAVLLVLLPETALSTLTALTTEERCQTSALLTATTTTTLLTAASLNDSGG
jgi:hypothetical protein